MKSIATSIMCCILLVVGGCAPSKSAFNKDYFLNVAPDEPNQKIELPLEFAERAWELRGVFRIGCFGKYTYLNWLEEDNILLRISSDDGKEILYSYLVTPSNGQARLLEGAERESLLSKIAQASNVESIESKAGGFFKALLGAVSEGQLRMESKWIGRVDKNGTVIDFDIASKCINKYCTQGYMNFSAKNRVTGSTVSGQNGYHSGWLINEWLKSWNVSPDGRLYFVGSEYLLIDPSKKKEKAFSPLISNPRIDCKYAYKGIDVNPNWNKVALLVMKQDESKMLRAWLEFYPLTIAAK